MARAKGCCQAGNRLQSLSRSLTLLDVFLLAAGAIDENELRALALGLQIDAPIRVLTQNAPVEYNGAFR
ncbi:hypothetical protein E4U24_008044, partial [Claviceps purpurea]